MKRFVRFAQLSVMLALLIPLSAGAWDRGQVKTFATLPDSTLPDGGSHPEGIAVDATGNVYVATFAVGGTPSGVAEIFVFGPHGDYIRTLTIPGTSTLLLGIAFHPNGAFLVIDFGTKQVLAVDPLTGASGVFTTIPGGENAGPNAMAFDSEGNVYISDSFQGIIWQTGPTGAATPVAWAGDLLLMTSGVPPFGANGLAFNSDESILFVANTGDDTVVKIPVDPDNGNAGTPEVFVNSVHGADGLIIDENDNLWIAANQADEIVVLDSSGRGIAKLGDFHGIGKEGEPMGLLFPASLVRVGEDIYVTNLALDLRLFGLAQTVDSQWTEQVTKYTVSQISAKLPKVSGLP